ncbi:MAG: hypothetical protein ACI4Q5_05950, partial [Porcipelethomonas sp.]
MLTVCLVFAQVTQVFATDNMQNAQEEQVQEEQYSEVQEEANTQEPKEAESADKDKDYDSAESYQQLKPQKETSEESMNAAEDTASKKKTNSLGTPADETIKDGTYLPDEFTFSGGTGRVQIKCPEVTIKDGKAAAKIVFTSSSYTALKVNGTSYTSIVDTEAKTSTFSNVAVDVNEDVTITGTTVGMGDPKDINYVIHIKLSSDSQETEATEPGGSSGGSEGGEDPQEPIISEKLSNGTYKVKSDTDNRMFYIVTGSDGIKWSVLKVASSGMQATITLTGTGYDYLYMGTAAEAAKVSKSKLSKYTASNGYYSYTVPVSALDKDLTIAAHSAKKNVWYEHTIIFYSKGAVKVKDDTSAVVPSKPNTSTKEDEADGKKATSKQTSKVSKSWKDDSGKGTSAVDNSTKLKDGTYTPAGFSWSGGTGRLAYIKCTKIDVKNGQAFGVIEFGSTKYDQLKANGRIYSNSNSGGLSTFVIPVQLNANNTIIARTTAMSQIHWIQYSIFISLPVKSDGTVDTSKAQAETNKL